MAHSYYLLNGKKGNGKALYLLKNGELIKNFKDISALDLQTMDISGNNAKELLSEYNPDIDLSGMFYDASYPHSKTKTKTYVTIFNFENKDVDYYFHQLRHFAEQRNYKKEHRNKLKLEHDRIFDDYMRRLLYNVMKIRSDKLISYDSLISFKIKELIRDKKYNYSDMGINNYINSKIYLFRDILSNYTELRNITLEYMLYLQGMSTDIRSDINRYKYWDNYGMEEVEPIKYVKGEKIPKPKTYTQMELADYITGFPKVRKLNKR
ncbi:MAG: hypothetical protein IKF19_00485 [Bacilli bacterium]|nr:hypothetical protein [Bacilli bacterium]